MIREEAGLSDLFFLNVSTILKHPPNNIPSENEIKADELSFPRVIRNKVRDLVSHPSIKTMFILDITKIYTSPFLTHVVKITDTNIILQSYFNVSQLSGNNFL